MATWYCRRTMATPLQNSDVPQPNTDSGLQPQNESNIPSTTSTSDLQSNANDVNNLRTTNLKVTTGPVTSLKKASSGTVISIILVAVILIAAAALFIASLRVKDEEKAKDGMPSVAVGGEENGSLGTQGLSRRARKALKKKNRR